MEHIINRNTEYDVKSSITLATRRIEEIGQYLYFRFLRKRLIPEDMCSELYEGIIEHLKNYREKNPEVKKVKRAFVTTCANWIAGKLRRRGREEESRETMVMDILKNELDALGSSNPCRLSKKYEKKIIITLRELLETNKLKKRHALYYILYHSYNSRPEFSLRLLKAAGLKTGQNIRRMKAVRRHVHGKSSGRRDALLANIENKYSKVLKAHYDISRFSDTGMFGEAGLKKSELDKLNRDRKKAFARLSAIKMVPSIKYLAGMLKAPWSTVEYGVRRAEKMVLEKAGGAVAAG